jgi:predicted ribosome quality control (RQC) complex YloA/Tae2 family protein
MRDEMSGLDLRQVVTELSEYIGSHCKKIYQPHHEQLVLRIKAKEKSPQDLVIVRGKRVYLSKRERPMPMQPAPFAMLLRKHLGNGRLTAVSQHGFDRIITLDFDTKEGPRHLVVECFRDGNVILADSTFTIIQPLTHARYSGRILKKGEPYQFPPEVIDPHDLDTDAIQKLLSESKRNVVRTLAGRASLGGPLANAVLQISGVSGDSEAEKISEDSEVAGKISAALSGILVELATAGDKVPGGWLMLPVEKLALDDGEEIDISHHTVEASPVQMPAHSEFHCIPFPRFVDAVDAWVGDHDATALARRQSEAVETIGGRAPSTPSETLERRFAQQKSSLQSFSDKIRKQQEYGHAIQNNWSHVEELLTQVNNEVASNGWEVALGRFKEIPWIESGDPAQASIVAILPDESGAAKGAKVTLLLSMSVHQNAQQYFDNANKHKEKSKGAEVALKETETLFLRAHKKESKRKESGHVARVKRTKRLWFENHRWTIIDGMHLLIGGRDAKGNDTIVKKHLKGDDRYVHADLHGAPSCAMKLQQGFVADPNPPANLPPGVPAFRLSDNIEVADFSDVAFEQAATMALCWSRGWSGGGGATAFIVKPGQVSKQAESGEYVAKGSFIVRGSRNWYKDLRTRLGLGLVCINGIPLLMAGTPAQVVALCERRIELIPGRDKRERIASRLSKATGLSVDDIVPVIPGTAELVADHGLINPHNHEEE